MKTFKEFSNCECFRHELTEAEYQGKKVELNNPTRSSDGKKKFYVYVKNEKGNVIKYNYVQTSSINCWFSLWCH